MQYVEIGTEVQNIGIMGTGFSTQPPSTRLEAQGLGGIIESITTLVHYDVLGWLFDRPAPFSRKILW